MDERTWEQPKLTLSNGQWQQTKRLRLAKSTLATFIARKSPLLLKVYQYSYDDRAQEEDITTTNHININKGVRLPALTTYKKQKISTMHKNSIELDFLNYKEPIWEWA